MSQQLGNEVERQGKQVNYRTARKDRCKTNHKYIYIYPINVRSWEKTVINGSSVN